jgi:hypothetical protein
MIQLQIYIVRALDNKIQHIHLWLRDWDLDGVPLRPVEFALLEIHLIDKLCLCFYMDIK